MAVMGGVTVQAVAPGIIGASTGALLNMQAGDLPPLAMVAIVTASVIAGMLAASARAPQRRARRIMLEAAAIWMAALFLGFTFSRDMLSFAVICMATGLSGARVLNVMERIGPALLRVAGRAMGLPDDFADK